MIVTSAVRPSRGSGADGAASRLEAPSSNAAAASSDERPRRSTVVVCGDSTATALGLEGRAAVLRTYPALVKSALRPVGVRVISQARPGRTIEASLADVDRLIALDPDVVVISHGGLENIVYLPGLLRRLQVPPPVGGLRDRPLQRVRWTLYRPFLLVLRNPGAARIAERFGIGPGRSIEWVLRTYRRFLDAVMEGTSATVVLISPPSGTMGFQPWRERGVVALSEMLAAAAEGSPRVRFVDARAALSGRDHFQRDGVHLTDAGHQEVAVLLGTAIRSLLVVREDSR